MIVDVDAEVVANTRLSADYNVIALAAPAIAAEVKPGQFVMVRLASGSDPLLRRPFSIFEILRDERGRATAITLLNKRIGVGTRLLFEMTAGRIVPVLGPLGRPFDVVDPPIEAWLVAGGVGLAPFATLAQALRAHGAQVTLFYGGRSARDLFYIDWFGQLGVRSVLTTEDGTLGERGRVTVPLEREVRSLDSAHQVMIYACGPEAMLEEVARIAARFGRPSQVSVERVMGCGLGGCYSCVIPIRDGPNGPHFVRSCIGGPVFRGEDIVWS
ncbi:MAG: dihydroorotate dehydrogenase electron transfer subunit [Acidobacteria bacterium]|nr:dihydroorotate dehydrogenase electron transfer subunit [Acidobacteriota bacterium]